jgi:hypothetical protein
MALLAPGPATLCYNQKMKWPQWYPTRADIMGVLFAAAIICLFAFAVIRFPDLQQRRTNAGFGPDWDCTVVPKGEPICIRKPSP